MWFYNSDNSVRKMKFHFISTDKFLVVECCPDQIFQSLDMPNEESRYIENIYFYC